MANNVLEEKVAALINKYKEVSEKAAILQEKTIALESACAQKDAKIAQLEEEALNREIRDEEIYKNIEQVLDLAQQQ